MNLRSAFWAETREGSPMEGSPKIWIKGLWFFECKKGSFQPRIDRGKGKKFPRRWPFPNKIEYPCASICPGRLKFWKRMLSLASILSRKMIVVLLNRVQKEIAFSEAIHGKILGLFLCSDSLQHEEYFCQLMFSSSSSSYGGC